MQLKKIIIKGFKSFPDKTILEFNEGVTAIVGPNGSGKSNIIEAIRWVMGEQSAKTLRGTRMNDVIFSGTHERKPLNIAEVEIILDNSDEYLDIGYEEVSVLRRISRSGDSTYMINKQECRLKDIVDLFMDSGLGKESFSIISQGQVEAIFNSKPEDRRGIFEEAAGVFKYKVRKQDAEKKLSQTQENLDRVQDIIYELEAQLEPLKKQSDIAQSYLEQKEKLTDLDIGVTVWQITDYINKIKEEKVKQQEIQSELTKNQEDSAELEMTIELHQQRLNELEAQREMLNRELVDVVRQKERTESSLKLYDEKERHREVFIGEKEASIQQIKDRTDELVKQLDEVTKNFKVKNKALNELTAKMNQLVEDRNYLEGDKELQKEELRSLYIELLQQQTSYKNEIKHLEQMLERNSLTEEKSKTILSDLEESVRNNQEALEEKKSSYQTVNQQLLEMLSQYSELETAFNQGRESIQVKATSVNKTINELERAKAKQSSLLEMQDNYAGYYAGVRSIMKNKEQIKGIIGTVAELIRIPEDYIQAIDTVLGSSGQFIVVENEKSGRDAINFLKQHKSGRATFLPLTSIKPRYVSESVKQNIQSIPGYVGIASELVGNDPQVQTIIDNLLGHTIVADTLEAANEIARAIQFRNRVVTLEGDVMNAGGSMTGGGGRQNNTSPIFSQKVELDNLTKFISENEKVLQQLVKNHTEAEEALVTIETQLQETRSQGETLRIDEQRLKSELESLEQQVDRLERELKVTSFEADEQLKQYDAQKEQLSMVEKQLSDITIKVEDCNNRMELLTSEQENIEEEKEKLTHEIQNLNENRTDLREELASIRTTQESLERQITQNNEHIKELTDDIVAFSDDVQMISKETLEEQLKTYTMKQEEIEKEQTAHKVTYQEETQTSKDYKERLTVLNGRRQYLSEEKSKLDVSISRNDVKTDHLLNYLVEEYKIGYEEAKLLEHLDIEIEEAQKQVRLLKRGIEELGPVNVNAIEEYESIAGRYEFLSGQQNDLIEAKANLYNTMDEMDAIVEKQFKETFDKIQKEFSNVFPKMFGGGYAELVLNDPDNLLETGIEIIAQPPGKRLTRLSLLSGGERALTAISLLFAIIQVNPIPFCILDEAEAALDDANVDRFGKYLEEFDNDTQFIVITHRKGTMEHADQLYGITMQEKGISKIVSVSLSEAQAYDGVS